MSPNSRRDSIEAVPPDFTIDGLRRARDKTIHATRKIRNLIQEGMTEDEARRLALKVLLEMGASKHWHRPYIRFGAGTALTFHEPLQPYYRLKADDPFYIDLGPVWSDPDFGLEYEGDFGETYVLGNNPEASRCAADARELFVEAQAHWKESQATGKDIYAFLSGRASALGYDLVCNVDGHRIGSFPHQRHSKERLAHVPFVPSTSLWVLEIQINDPAKRFGAFYEDAL